MRAKELEEKETNMVETTQNGVAMSVKVIATTNLKAPVFSGKHGDKCTI